MADKYEDFFMCTRVVFDTHGVTFIVVVLQFHLSDKESSRDSWKVRKGFLNVKHNLRWARTVEKQAPLRNIRGGYLSRATPLSILKLKCSSNPSYDGGCGPYHRCPIASAFGRLPPFAGLRLMVRFRGNADCLSPPPSVPIVRDRFRTADEVPL